MRLIVDIGTYAYGSQGFPMRLRAARVAHMRAPSELDLALVALCAEMYGEA